MRRRASMRLAVLSALACLAACRVAQDANGERSIEGSEAAVVFGDDDRRDYYEVAGDFATAGRASVVALVRSNRLEQVGPTYEIVGEPTLDESYDLCASERFSDQPTLAFCSGTLIDDDLVLTAGHCILPVGPLGAGTPHCETTRFVFDFLETADGVLAPIGPNDVYGCRAVVAHHLDDELDYAVVQLDRPVVGRVPAPVAPPGRLAIGTPVSEIGFPNGVPMKFDAGGTVTDPGPKNGSYFVTDLDSFHGNSGSGVRDASGAVVGILVRTLVADYVYDGNARCYRASHLPSTLASEMATYSDRAMEALCVDAAYPSVRLCGRAPSCGDGYCTSSDAPSCADCMGPVCGDGVVMPPETVETCPYDFSATVGRSGGGGCAVVPHVRSRFAVIAFALALLLLAHRRRAAFAWARRAAPLAALVIAFSASLARAEPSVEPRGARFIGAVEGTTGTSTLRDPSGTFPSVSFQGLGGAVRVGVDVGFHRYFALEISAAARGFLDLDTTHFELTVAPRIRFRIRSAQEIYIRVPMGAGYVLVTSDEHRPSGVFGLSLGYRRQLTRVVDIFGEIGASVRFVRDLDPTYGFVHGYGFHPSAPPSLVTSAFGLTLGIGIGRGAKPRRVCPSPEAAAIP